MNFVPPVVAFARHRGRYVQRSVTFHGDQRLDVWHDGARHSRRPMMIFVPGGGWVSGSRTTFQGHALMSRMVERGWTCLSIDYRTAPAHRWPAPLEDVCAAVDWARENGQRYGGDPNFVAIVGASAGGHMAALAGLRPGFVDAAVSLYGSYDWVDRSSLRRRVFMAYLENVVVGRRFDHCPMVFRDASPILMVNEYAAPMMIVHGDKDLLIPVREARWFYRHLAYTSYSNVEWLQIDGGLHAFDLVHPGQTVQATRAIADFLDREFSAARLSERATS